MARKKRKGTYDKIDRWLSSLVEEDILAEIEDLGRRAEEVVRQINELAAEHQRISVELKKAQEVLQMKRRWQPPITETVTNVATATQTADEAVVPRRGREAIRALMREHPGREWRPADILEALVERQWAEPDDIHSVQVSLSRLYRAEEIERPDRGVYRWPNVTANGVGGAIALPLRLETTERNEAPASTSLQR
jgi:hypothetical protein